MRHERAPAVRVPVQPQGVQRHVRVSRQHILRVVAHLDGARLDERLVTRGGQRGRPPQQAAHELCVVARGGEDATRAAALRGCKDRDGDVNFGSFVPAVALSLVRGGADVGPVLEGVAHAEGLPDAGAQEGRVVLAGEGLDDVGGGAEHDVGVLQLGAQGRGEGEVAQVAGQRAGVVRFGGRHAQVRLVVRGDSRAVAEDVLEGYLVGEGLRGQDEVRGEELGDWGLPLHVWVVGIVDEERGRRCRGALGDAGQVEDGFCSALFVWEFGVTVGLWNCQ